MDLQRAVVVARERAATLHKEWETALAAWQGSMEIAMLLDCRREANEQQEKAETALREAALREYGVTGDKQPLLGCGIRVSEKLVYPEGQALLWANDHHMALKLDVREFEKLMEAQTLKPAWVTIQPQVTATIATDLGAFLPTEALESPGTDKVIEEGD